MKHKKRHGLRGLNGGLLDQKPESLRKAEFQTEIIDGAMRNGALVGTAYFLNKPSKKDGYSIVDKWADPSKKHGLRVKAALMVGADIFGSIYLENKTTRNLLNGVGGYGALLLAEDFTDRRGEFGLRGLGDGSDNSDGSDDTDNDINADVVVDWAALVDDDGSSDVDTSASGDDTDLSGVDGIEGLEEII